MYIKVRVKAGERKEKIDKKALNTFNISVKEKAENNQANRRICEIVSSVYGVQLKEVRIVSGHHKSSKLLLIND
jgi:uncharacterized protein YggU (UPF0235/DUF167 family)